MAAAMAASTTATVGACTSPDTMRAASTEQLADGRTAAKRPSGCTARGVGAVFDRRRTATFQRNFGGHRYRVWPVGDRNGPERIRTLQDHGIHRGLDVHMEHTVISLLTDDGRVSGAVAYDRERGRFKVFRAKTVVVATGGLGRAFSITSNSWEYTGDGYVLAYDIGAALQDMEFVQFHPTGMVWPPSVRGILVTEAVRGEGGVLKNRRQALHVHDMRTTTRTRPPTTKTKAGATQGDKSRGPAGTAHARP